MTFRVNAMGAGTPALQAGTVIGGVVAGLAATGSTQADALVVGTTSNAQFSTVAAGTGVILPGAAVPGDNMRIYNNGANALSVYPPSGAGINNGAVNAAFSLAVNKSAEFRCLTPTMWGVNLSS